MRRLRQHGSVLGSRCCLWTGLLVLGEEGVVRQSTIQMYFIDVMGYCAALNALVWLKTGDRQSDYVRPVSLEAILIRQLLRGSMFWIVALHT